MGVTHDTRPDLDQSELLAGQRPFRQLFGQLDAAEEGGQVVGQCVQLQRHLDVNVTEPSAGQVHNCAHFHARHCVKMRHVCAAATRCGFLKL